MKPNSKSVSASVKSAPARFATLVYCWWKGGKSCRLARIVIGTTWWMHVPVPVQSRSRTSHRSIVVDQIWRSIVLERMPTETTVLSRAKVRSHKYFLFCTSTLAYCHTMPSGEQIVHHHWNFSLSAALIKGTNFSLSFRAPIEEIYLLFRWIRSPELDHSRIVSH